MAADCLDESTVLAFLDGTLAPEPRARVERHLTTCPACEELTVWAAADLASAADGSPERRSRERARRRAVEQLPLGSHVGRYQILSTLGRGGMGEVYGAYHPDLDRRIALKVVFESGAVSSERRTRLLREARAIARLSHPNVVTVYDAGTVGDHVYIAMEYVDGQTVDDWRRAAVRQWREVVDVFLAAGRGLAAAHAAEIVHRDFKPSNVMIGKDGAVRVMDFGLARLVREAVEPSLAEAPGTPPSVFPATVTRTGAMLGTPAYMAPEQFRGEPVDARADQFSFCVALYEALHGTRPTLAHLDSSSSHTARGETPAPPRVLAGGPRWLRAIVRRGLSPRPEGRFESMNGLLAALARGRGRRARRLTALAAAGAIALTAWGSWRATHPRRFDCQAPAARVAAVWAENPSDDRRRTIQRALLSSGRPDAETVWGRLSSELDGHLGRWRAMYRDACEATHVRGEQSSEVLDLRMQCLAESLDETRALADSLVSPGRGLGVSEIVAATTGLSPIARCADVVSLHTTVPPPRDPRVRSAVEGLGQAVRGLRVQYDLGRVEDAIARARALRPAVVATHYPPLLGRLLELTGLMMVHHSDPAEAEATLHEAFAATEVGRDDETRAKVLVHLVACSTTLRKYQEAQRWSRLAGAVLDRLGPGHLRIRAWAAQNEAYLLGAMFDNEGARRLYERAIALKEGELGPDHPDVATALMSLGNTLNLLGRPGQALAVEDRALAIFTRHSEPNSSFVGYTHNNRGEALLRLGRVPDARAAFEQSLTILAKHDPTGNLISYPLNGIGQAMLAAGDTAHSVEVLGRALRLREQYEKDPPARAEVRFPLARALWEGGDKKRALALAQVARQEYAGPERAAQKAEVETWLATRSPK